MLNCNLSIINFTFEPILCNSNLIFLTVNEPNKSNCERNAPLSLNESHNFMQMLYNNLYSISQHGNEIGCSTLFILYRSNINRYHKKGGREPRRDTWCHQHIGDRTDYKQRTFRGLFGEATQIIMHFLWNRRLMALSCFNNSLCCSITQSKWPPFRKRGNEIWVQWNALRWT